VTPNLLSGIDSVESLSTKLEVEKVMILLLGVLARSTHDTISRHVLTSQCESEPKIRRVLSLRSNLKSMNFLELILYDLGEWI
jgi:hypothetical protein